MGFVRHGHGVAWPCRTKARGPVVPIRVDGIVAAHNDRSRYVPSRLSLEDSIPTGALPRSRGRDQVESVEIHHLAPRGHEVTHELLLRVVAGIAFRDGPELRVRTEDEVDGGAGPPDLPRPAVTPLVEVLAHGGLPPLRAHVEQVHEEVVGQ